MDINYSKYVLKYTSLGKQTFKKKLIFFLNIYSFKLLSSNN